MRGEKPYLMKVAARFKNAGGSLDRRWVEGSPDRYGYKSPAEDLALPASTTWSNNLIKEAVARKGGRNNRNVAERVVGRFTDQEDRAAEKRLGRDSGYFTSKTWQNYDRQLGKRVCGACYGACCNAMRDFISRLVEAHFLPAESQSPSVSFVEVCCFSVIVSVVSGLQ